jgi:hypothetical protein
MTKVAIECPSIGCDEAVRPAILISFARDEEVFPVKVGVGGLRIERMLSRVSPTQ